MVKLKTKDKTLEDIRMAYIKKSLFSGDDKIYVCKIIFRLKHLTKDTTLIHIEGSDLYGVHNFDMNTDDKISYDVETHVDRGYGDAIEKDWDITHGDMDYEYKFHKNPRGFYVVKSPEKYYYTRTIDEKKEYNLSTVSVDIDDSNIATVKVSKQIHQVKSISPLSYIDQTISINEEANIFKIDNTMKNFTMFIVYNNDFNIDTVKVFRGVYEGIDDFNSVFLDIIDSDEDQLTKDTVFSTVNKKVDITRKEVNHTENKNVSTLTKRDIVENKFKSLTPFMETDNIEFPDGTYIFKDTKDDIKVDDPDYYFPMVMYGNNIGRYTQEYLNPGNDNYYNDANIKRILLDTPEGDKVSKNILKISDIIFDTCHHVILHDLGGYLGITLGNDDGYDKHYLEVIKDAYGEFDMSVLPDVSGYINKLFSYTDSIRYYADSFESDCEDTKVYDFSNLNNIKHKLISIKKLVYTDKIFMNEEESAGIDILNLIIEYTYNSNVYLYNITAMYSNVNDAIMNININCSVNKKDSFAINLNQIDNSNLLCYSYIDNSNDVAVEVPISARLLKYSAEPGLSRLSKTFIYDIYPSGDSYSDIFDKIDYPVYSAFSAGIRIK